MNNRVYKNTSLVFRVLTNDAQPGINQNNLKINFLARKKLTDVVSLQIS
jgi:hypothetical protein